MTKCHLSKSRWVMNKSKDEFPSVRRTVERSHACLHWRFLRQPQLVLQFMFHLMSCSSLGILWALRLHRGKSFCEAHI